MPYFYNMYRQTKECQYVFRRFKVVVFSELDPGTFT